MSLTMMVIEGTGRAMCKICDKKILKGQKQINVQGWRTSGSMHSAPWDCNDERMDVADLASAATKIGGKK